MEKLYLIRRNLETIVGPMTIQEFRRGFEHMEFGLQDEIAGHCSRWVFLDNPRMLKRYYPAINKLLEDHVKSWSDGLGRPALRDTKVDQPLGQLRKNYTLIFLALLVVGGLGWYFGPLLLEGGHAPSSQLKEVSLSEATTLYEAARFGELEQFMQGSLDSLMVKSQGTALEAWLPYVRWYAYRNQGALNGVPSKLLRGAVSDSMAPLDCSLSHWKERFRAGVGEWKGFLEGYKLPSSAWARLLAWDPDWIRRRPQVGWLKPESYYGACLYMGLLAVHELSGEEDFIKLTFEQHKETGAFYLQAIKTRLAWLSYLVNGTQRPVLQPNRKANGSLELWTCWEAAANPDELDGCQGLMGKGGDNAGEAHHRFRYHMAWARLLLGSDSEARSLTSTFLSREQLESLSSPVNDGIDPYTKIDYRAEALFLKQLLREHNDFAKSLERARAEYPSVLLSDPRN